MINLPVKIYTKVRKDDNKVEIIVRPVLILSCFCWFCCCCCYCLLLESFRFYDEYDYEYEIFSVLFRARAWTRVILAGKRARRRHSTTRVLAKRRSHCGGNKPYSLSNAGRFYHLTIGRGLIKITILTSLVKIVQWGFSGCLFLNNMRKNFKSNLVLAFESKGFLLLLLMFFFFF